MANPTTNAIVQESLFKSPIQVQISKNKVQQQEKTKDFIFV